MTGAFTGMEVGLALRQFHYAHRTYQFLRRFRGGVLRRSRSHGGGNGRGGFVRFDCPGTGA